LIPSKDVEISDATDAASYVANNSGSIGLGPLCAIAEKKNGVEGLYGALLLVGSETEQVWCGKIHSYALGLGLCFLYDAVSHLSPSLFAVMPFFSMALLGICSLCGGSSAPPSLPRPLKMSPF